MQVFSPAIAYGVNKVRGRRSIFFFVFTVPEGVSPPDLEVSSSSSLNASWTEPEHPNGVIISYSLHMRNLSIYSVLYQGSSLSYHVTGLSAGQEYSFYIMANTSVGGTRSEVVTASVPLENTPSEYPNLRSMIQLVTQSRKDQINNNCMKYLWEPLLFSGNSIATSRGERPKLHLKTMWPAGWVGK